MTITLDEAREIAYAWHGGGGSHLYSFASTGDVKNITEDTVHDVDVNMMWCAATQPDETQDPAKEMARLVDLRAYLVANMPEQPEEDDEDETEYSGPQCPHGARSGEHCSACGEIPFDQ